MVMVVMMNIAVTLLSETRPFIPSIVCGVSVSRLVIPLIIPSK